MTDRPAPQDEPRLDTLNPVRPQLLVALGGRSGEDTALVRATHRHAQREGVHWRAVHVDNGRASARQRLELDQVLALVGRLGGEVRIIQGAGRARELHEYATEQRVATLMVGRTRPSGWRFWRRPLAERLLRYGGAYDLVVAAEARQRSRFRPIRQRHPLGRREGVFDMFFTGGEGDRGRHGSGLGLAICRGMLGAHGGSVEAEPGPRGCGTAIVMRLPLETSEGRNTNDH
jgi:two-component system sensor histidine kinase KdpD